MQADFIFRTGKYSGKTYQYVATNHPHYIDWVIFERPDMLQERNLYGNKPKDVIPDYLQEDNEEGYIRFKPLTPNYNFDNETIMTATEITYQEKEVRLQMTKMKVGLYAKLSKETNTDGSVKYTNKWLIDIIFDSEQDAEIKSKLKKRINV